MSIAYQVLGLPQTDNALYVRVDTGHSIHRLLFDCGEGCPAALPFSELQQIDHLCFSHLHMDHISGFDTFFRATFNREHKPITVWGPPGTSAILQHRFQGFLWNLHQDQPGTWLVHDLHPGQRAAFRFETHEAYAIAHPAGVAPFAAAIIEEPTFTVEALHLDHGTPSMGYLIRERPHLNINTERLAELGLPPGPWLHELKEPPASPPPTIEIAGAQHDRQALSELLLVATPGDSLAYLTDFRLDPAAEERVGAWLQGCATLVCEGEYRAEDRQLAERNCHMTTVESASLARRAGAGQLVLIHLSARYQRTEWRALLAEAQAVFPNTTFASHWARSLP